MKLTRKTLCASMVCGCLFAVTGSAQTMIEGFEYADDTELMAEWYPESGSIALSSYVATGSTGTNSLRVDRYFASAPWDTQVIFGPALTTPVAIAPAQYVTLRLAGDPQFTNASYNQLFVYAYDSAGNFGRWGTPVPTGTNWQVFNLLASTIAVPWNSPGLPDLNDIVQFQIYIYGQGDPAGTDFPATFYIDDLMIRDTPLIEFPPPSAMRAKIDDFEGYADDAALMSFYHYVNSPAATATSASLETPAPQGDKALKLTIDFAAGQYPWGAVYSPNTLTPFSFPENAVVSLKLKGDPALAPVADGGTVFYLSFYDQAGSAFNYTIAGGPVISSEWTTLKAAYGQFWSGGVVDTGNIVGWRILVEGWTGTSESTPLSGTFYIDDIQITVPPVLSLVPEGNSMKLQVEGLIPGTTYTLGKTTDFSTWTTSTLEATNTSMTLDLPISGEKGFYQLSYTP